jgi:hypothetical protein
MVFFTNDRFTVSLLWRRCDPVYYATPCNIAPGLCPLQEITGYQMSEIVGRNCRMLQVVPCARAHSHERNHAGARMHSSA